MTAIIRAVGRPRMEWVAAALIGNPALVSGYVVHRIDLVVDAQPIDDRRACRVHADQLDIRGITSESSAATADMSQKCAWLTSMKTRSSASSKSKASINASVDA